MVCTQPKWVARSAFVIQLFVFGAVTAISAPIDPEPRNLLAPGQDWPRWRGQTLADAAVASDQQLVDNYSQARLVWTSDDDLPWGKNCSSGDWSCGIIQGGYSSPVVAEGRVYLFYFLGSGTVYDTRGQNRQKDLIEADDIVHCWDAQTGRTLWKKVFDRAGINWGTPGKTGPMCTPSVRNGKVYAMGTLGDIYCLDAATGDLVWQDDIGLRHEMMVQLKAKCLARKELFGFNRDFMTSPMVIGDAVVSNSNGMMKGDNLAWGVPDDKPIGLIAHDALTGAKLWYKEGIAGKDVTPLPWAGGGKEYVITATDGYLAGTTGLKVFCLDPRTGEELWQAAAGSNGFTPFLDGNRLIGNIDEAIGCFELTPTAATRKWVLPSGYGFFTGDGVVLDGHLFAQLAGGILRIDIATGTIVSFRQRTFRGAYCWMVGGQKRLFTRADVVSPLFDCEMWDTRPDTVALAGKGLPVVPASGYDVPIVPCIVDGRMFIRTQQKGIACLDLRTSPSSARAPSGPEQPGVAALSSRRTMATTYDLRGRIAAPSAATRVVVHKAATGAPLRLLASGRQAR